MNYLNFLKLIPLGNFSPSNNGTRRGSESSNFDSTEVTGRIFENAILELKSSDAAVDIKERSKGLTKLQMRRKTAKIEEISCSYEMKTGIKISIAHSGNKGRSSLSKILNKEGVEYRASSSLRTKSGHQKAVKSHKIYIVDNARCTSSLSSTGQSTVSSSSLDGEYGYVQSVACSPMNSIQLISKIKMKLNGTDEDDDENGKYSGISIPDLKGLEKVPFPPRRGRSRSASKTSKAITAACNKYSTFQKLENILTNQSIAKKLNPLKPDDLEKLRRIRAKEK